MKKAVTFIQKYLLTPSVIKLMTELHDGPKSTFQLRDAGVGQIDTALYVMGIVDIDDTSSHKSYSLTESGMAIAASLVALLKAIDTALPGGS